MERWKDIKGYEGRYVVSDMGRIKRLARTTANGKKLKERMISPFMNNGKNGRKDLRVSLQKDGIKRNFLVSRLVAEAFIPNPSNLSTVNHKDEDLFNNSVDNLEWLSVGDNIRYGTGIERRRVTLKYVSPSRKPVKPISACARGCQKTAEGYKWEYLVTRNAQKGNIGRVYLIERK